jgi:hypothetical protein
MAGLVPAIHGLLSGRLVRMVQPGTWHRRRNNVVEGRHTAGHDETKSTAADHWRSRLSSPE